MASFFKIELGPDHVNPHLKVFLKDISKNQEMADLLEGLNSVDHVNVTPKSGGKSDLTLYPNRAYEIEEVKEEVVGFLDVHFAAGGAVAAGPHTPASATPSAATATSATPAAGPLTVFISYSWDGKPHRDWVLALADKLTREGGVKVLLDQYEIRAGKNITHFMERSIQADKVVMIMTPNYKLKADQREGGVGFEYSMITTQLYAKQDAGKFIPVARVGKYYECSPAFISTLISLDMTDDKQFDEQFIELLRLIYDVPYIVAPPIGPKPVFTVRSAGVTSPTPAAPAAAPGVAPPIIGKTALIDDAANMAECKMPSVAHWTFNFKLISLAGESQANLFRQIHKHRIPQESGRYFLPFVLNDVNKKSHHPDVDYVMPLKRGLAVNMFAAEALKITQGHIIYEYAEYSDHEMMLLQLNQPFVTLLSLLLIVKEVHLATGSKPAVEIEVGFKSNRKSILYLIHSPIRVPRIYGMQTMIIPGSDSSRKMTVSEITQDSLFDVFQELYSMFMAEDPSSALPYVELDKNEFIKVISEFISK